MSVRCYYEHELVSQNDKRDARARNEMRFLNMCPMRDERKKDRARV